MSNQENTDSMKGRSADEVREIVSGHYASAVKTAVKAGSGCCGPSTPVDISTLASAEPGTQEHVLEQFDREKWRDSMGYDAEELADVPADAINASFGCGDPVNLAGIQEGDTVVDLGSGAGIDVILAAKRVGPTGHVIGIDMTEDMIAQAEKNIAAAGITHAEIRRGIIEDLPVDGGTVDWMISNCVINLSPEKPKVFAEAARVLKPGGQFLVSDIVVGDLPDEIRENVLGYVACVGGAVAEDEYLGIIRDAGFEDVSVAARHVYSRQELLGFAGQSEIPEGAAGEMVKHVLDQLDGKIVSIKVHARKAAADSKPAPGCC